MAVVSHEPNGATVARPRRRFRFSLRTFLVLVTLCCVLSVWLARESDRARKQARAVAKLQQFGVTLGFDYEYDATGAEIPNAEPWAPPALRQAVGEEFFRRVTHVSFRPSKLHDSEASMLEAMESLDQLADVTTLSLVVPRHLTDEMLVHVAHLEKVRTLNLSCTHIDGSGLVHLRRMRELEELTLVGTSVTDEALAHLQHNMSLRSVSLAATDIGDSGLANLQNVTSLRSLSLGSTSITNVGLAYLSKLDGLEYLSLSGTDITATGVRHLYNLKNLRELNIHRTFVTNVGVAELRKALPACKIRSFFD